ncbi:MAG: hypothetical protein ACFFDH_21040 [Promethearchaeota archaeon]
MVKSFEKIEKKWFKKWRKKFPNDLKRMEEENNQEIPEEFKEDLEKLTEGFCNKVEKIIQRDKNFTLVGELNDRKFDIPEYSNSSLLHYGENWDIDDPDFDDFFKNPENEKGSE